MRVFELAKDLGMDQKDLLRHLLDMGIAVSNNMSVLSPEDMQMVRERVGGERSNVVEEKRVTTRVIRRRRKKAAHGDDGEADGLDAADDADGEVDESEPEPPAPAKVVQERSEPPTAARIVAPAPKPEPTPEPEPPAIREAASASVAETTTQPEPQPKVVQEKPEVVAVSQAQPEPEPAPAPTSAQTPAPATQPRPSEPQASEHKPGAARIISRPKPEPPREEPRQAPRPEPRLEARPEPRPEGEGEARPDGRREVRPGQKKEIKVEAREKPKKKRRFEDEPARIISRPSPQAPPPPPSSAPSYQRPEPRGPRPPYRPPADGPAPGGDMSPPPPKTDQPRRRKRSRKGPATAEEEALANKLGVGRRKQVLDKADLYDAKRRGKGAKGGKKGKKTEVTTPKAIKRRVKVGESIALGELAKRMGIKATEVVAKLLRSGMMVTVNQTLDIEDAILVAAEFGFEIDRVGFEEEDLLERVVDQPDDLRPRPPVVTIMGHVDHGKTSLLDRIRKSNVVDGEAGGITQHVGAYDVRLPEGGRVVFVDTPGHEAFTQMRARGAQVTDVVVLVVAADDGVMQQTIEAINHSKAAGVPIVVAVNKIDKPGADIERVRRELADRGLVSEEWGGDTIFAYVSAKTGEGVDNLLELLGLQTEILELKANPGKSALGRIIEARLDKGRGAVATVLVQEGTLKNGDNFVCGVHAGKVRAMFDDLGRRVDEAGPSIPVEVQGFTGVPEAGDEFAVVESDKSAKRIAEHRQMKKRESELASTRKLSLENILDQLKEGAVQELALVVKADVQGSVEALVESLGKLGNDQVRVHVIHSATGAITETDVMLASASNAIIIGFNVRPQGKVAEMAEAEHVEIRNYDVIYQMVDDINKALTGLLAPEFHEEVIGRAEVRDTFSVPKIGTIAGCSVQSGKIHRGAQARLLRDGVVVATTKISSLRRFKEDVKEVVQGFECGIGLENYGDIKVGDEIEVFVVHEVAATL